jgi:hypothetical protein
MRNSGRQMDKTLTDRIIAFFDWRFETAEPLELQEFTFWLEAECLGSDWRCNPTRRFSILAGERMLDFRFR